MKFLINMLWPDGTEKLLDEEFDNEEEAEEYGCYMCGCYAQGRDMLVMGGEDYIDGDADFEIIEDDEE